MQNTTITLQSGPEWRKMTAKYAGRCCVCGKSIAAGDSIHYSSGYGAKHAACKYLTIKEQLAAGVTRANDTQLRRKLARQAEDEYQDDLLSARVANR